MIDNPEKIEKKSFEIIADELDIKIDKEYEPVIFRIIHTTADFEYARITEIHPDAIKKGISAIKKGCRIYTDTNMIKAGINKRILKNVGTDVYTLIDDDTIAEEAKIRGVTRSIVGMEKACKDPDAKIFVIGNAPTALFTLTTLIEKGEIYPDLVIGVPVGFVGASEVKEGIKNTGIPYIITRGRKGGSTVAVAIVNSLLYQI